MARETVERWLESERAAGRLSAATLAWVDGDHVDVSGLGRARPDSAAAPDAATGFQIGSVGKVLTHLLLAEMVARGEVSYDDTLGRLLSPPLSPRNPAVAEITLGALATHTSGLPRLPHNLALDDPDNPYAGYTAAMLRRAVDTAREGQPLGRHYAYSNFGVGLLGHVLAEQLATTYGDAVTALVTSPLGLRHTQLPPTPDAATPVSDGRAVRPWGFDDALAAAGAHWSSAADLARLIAVYLGHEPNPLAHPLAADLDVTVDHAGIQVTRVWHVAGAHQPPIYWHNGSTAGFHAFLGFRPDLRRGVAVLLSGDSDPTDVGLRALGHTPPPEPEVAFDRTVLGQYELTPAFGIGVFELGGLLVAQATGQQAFVLEPLGDDWYAMTDVDASLRFAREGRDVVAVELAQNGARQRARRVAAQAVAAARRAIDLDLTTLEAFVGAYRFAPGTDLTVSAGDDGLLARLTGQTALPIRPRRPDRFFYTVVDAELEFHRDDTGTVEAVTLHQGGTAQTARRVEAPDS